MKFKHLLTATAMMLSISVVAQPKTDAKENKEEGFKFETIKELPVTSVKNQNQAGTCWCYSSLAFFEAELLRMGKPEYDFSEMYIVYKTYLDRAEAAIRTQPHPWRCPPDHAFPTSVFRDRASPSFGHLACLGHQGTPTA